METDRLLGAWATLLVLAACGAPSAPDLGHDGYVDGGAASDATPARQRDPGYLEEVSVTVDPGAAKGWTIDPRILGKVLEHRGRDVYPGIYDQHIANGSFESWPAGVDADGDEVLYPGTPRAGGIAYPWQRRADPRGEPGVPGRPLWSVHPGGHHGHQFQRFETQGNGYHAGVYQRLALPDQRTLGYSVKFSLRGAARGPLLVRLETPSSEVLAEVRLPITDRWQYHQVPITLSRPSGSRYRGLPPFGEYVLVLQLVGEGQVDLDGLRLMPDDIVLDRFNPSTIATLREAGVTTMRWPGGDMANSYHWRDGVGRLRGRRVGPAYAAGGVETNYFGTDEFLAFCEVAGLEPVINVGFAPDITPEEAAAWVEYVNGAEDTPMGALRASHGRPEPYGVRLWQVGNEVYDPSQVGHTDADTFARRYRELHEAMKAADPTITVLAAGIDPGYASFGGNGWNETLLDVAGDVVEGVDVHRYVEGIEDAALRNERHPWEYLQTLILFPTQMEALLFELRRSARERGVSDLRIQVGDWDLQAKVSADWPRPSYSTMAYAVFQASMFNAFIRQGDAVRAAHQRDNTLLSRAYREDTRPLNPAAWTLRLYSEVLGGGSWHHVPVDVEGPVFDMQPTGEHIHAMEDVPLVDGAALVGAEGGEMYVFLANRSLNEPFLVRIDVAGGEATVSPVDISLQYADDPFTEDTRWDGRPGAFVTELDTLVPDWNGELLFRMPPVSVARLRVELER